jgi:hypothetical protein
MHIRSSFFYIAHAAAFEKFFQKGMCDMQGAKGERHKI